MTISLAMAQNALYVSGANATINYTKNITTTIPEPIFYISSSATNFYIDVVPTSSVAGIVFSREDNSLINETSKLRLYPNSQVKVPIRVKIDSSNFNYVVESQKSYDIKLKLIPVEIINIEQATIGTGGGGGGVRVGQTQLQPTSDTISGETTNETTLR